MTEHRIKAIIFDVWNTLIREDKAYELACQVLHELGTDKTPEEFAEAFDTLILADGLMPDFGALGKELGIDINEIAVQRMIQLDLLAKQAFMTFPHTIPMLSSLKKQGFKIAFLSNSSRSEIETFEKYTKITEYADVQVYSSTAGIRKPNPQIYIKVLEELGIEKEEAIMVGDSYEQDFLAPEQIGIKAIQFSTVEALRERFSELGIKVES